jgi:hypothetical protein
VIVLGMVVYVYVYGEGTDAIIPSVFVSEFVPGDGVTMEARIRLLSSRWVVLCALAWLVLLEKFNLFGMAC